MAWLWASNQAAFAPVSGAVGSAALAWAAQWALPIAPPIALVLFNPAPVT